MRRGSARCASSGGNKKKMWFQPPFAEPRSARSTSSAVREYDVAGRPPPPPPRAQPEEETSDAAARSAARSTSSRSRSSQTCSSGTTCSSAARSGSAGHILPSPKRWRRLIDFHKSVNTSSAPACSSGVAAARTCARSVTESCSR